MGTTTISLNLEKEDIEGLDRLIDAGIAKNRSEAVRNALSAYYSVTLESSTDSSSILMMS